VSTIETADRVGWRCDWLCEKWSEEAVDWARQRLLKRGVTHVENGVREVEHRGLRDRVASAVAGRPVYQKIQVPRLVAIERAVPSSVLRKLVGLPEDEVEIHGNLLLNEGIQEMWDLVCGEGSPTAYSTANAELGVGDSSTAADATQTNLQGGAEITWKAMNGSYPTRTNQTMAFQSDFATGDANYAWAEWGVRNGSTADKNMNRKVESLGTKASGTWTLTGSITLS
jgi:hypothetical protein